MDVVEFLWEGPRCEFGILDYELGVCWLPGRMLERAPEEELRTYEAGLQGEISKPKTCVS